MATGNDLKISSWTVPSFRSCTLATAKFEDVNLAGATFSKRFKGARFSK